MQTIYEKSKGLQATELHYCPGCSHGIVHKLIAEVLEEMDALDTAIAVCPVGCSVFAGNYFAFDTIEAAHGRAPAVATAVKRTHPDQPVFTYQGDGDLASIGAAEIVHAAMRGEKFTTIFINNASYGMTGGQMAPTTLIGQRATTAPLGRTKEQAGMPMRVAEMLSALDGLVYAERVCVTDIPHLNKADGRGGLHLHRGAGDLPNQLGNGGAGGQPVAAGQYGGLLSPWSHQRAGGAMR